MNTLAADHPSVTHVPETSLSRYLRKAWVLNNTYDPPGYKKKYRSPMWEFIRCAKAHPDLAALDGFDALSAVGECLATWDRGRDGRDIWRALFPESDDPRAEFCATWPNVKWAKASLELAMESATRLPLKPMKSYSPQYNRFVSVIGYLQQGIDGSILIPCRKFAELLGCTPMTISRYRNLAIESGLLKMTAKAPRAQRKADEFAFAIEKFDWETGEQIVTKALSICVTSETGCYTDTHDTERNKEPQEIEEKNEIEDIQRKGRAYLPDNRKCTIRQGALIPTTAQLREELASTKHLRNAQVGFPNYDKICS
jgi:hypothetical protein